MASLGLGIFEKAFRGKAKLFGIELESSFEKFLLENSSSLLRESGFSLSRLSAEQHGIDGKTLHIRAVLSNRKDQFSASWMTSLDSLFMQYDRARFTRDFEQHLIKRMFHELRDLIEKELIKYIEKTPRQERQKAMAWLSLDNWTSASANTATYTDFPVKSISSDSVLDSSPKDPYKNISSLIRESKKRLNKGPFKNLNWKYQYFN